MAPSLPKYYTRKTIPNSSLLSDDELKLLIKKRVLIDWLEIGEEAREFEDKFSDAVDSLIKDYGKGFFNPLIADVYKTKKYFSKYTAKHVMDVLRDEMA